tara:strand:- start:1419 stop:2153 length:735 start_codon:yes stop_codon:yes gene_type:complete
LNAYTARVVNTANILLAAWLALVISENARASESIPLEYNETHTLDSRHRAEQWGLTITQYGRYEILMAGQRGLWSPGLDPITALGVSTDSDAERRQLAELFVKTEFERTRKELAFQLAVDAAWQRLYPDTPRLVSFNPSTPDSTQSQRIAIILRAGSADAHDLVQRLLTRQQHQKHQPGTLDVHVVGTAGNDATLRAWADQLPALQQALAQGRATLNHGDQFREQLDLPAIYRKDGAGQWVRSE